MGKLTAGILLRFAGGLSPSAPVPPRDALALRLFSMVGSAALSLGHGLLSGSWADLVRRDAGLRDRWRGRLCRTGWW